MKFLSPILNFPFSLLMPSTALYHHSSGLIGPEMILREISIPSPPPPPPPASPSKATLEGEQGPARASSRGAKVDLLVCSETPWLGSPSPTGWGRASPVEGNPGEGKDRDCPLGMWEVVSHDQGSNEGRKMSWTGLCRNQRRLNSCPLHSF